MIFVCTLSALPTLRQGLLGLQREHIKSKMLFERETGRKVAGEGSLKPQA
nr:MAG TPA: hypothetical protein [Caudoviricetes sp.]